MKDQKPLLFRRITEEEQVPRITQEYQQPISFNVNSNTQEQKPLLFTRLFRPDAETDRLGERKVMKCGDEAVIIGYRTAEDIWVLFPSTGETVVSKYNTFKSGKIKSHFYPSLCGVGIVGFEKTSYGDGRTTHLPSYETWQSMIKRCYSPKLQAKFPTYKGCTVCDEWKYYGNFKKWYDENYYECNDGYRMELDKDILIKGNKVYSPETCVFVSHLLNSLFLKTNKRRGSLPVGVSYIQAEKKYMATCSLYDFETKTRKNKNLGLYDDPKEAFLAYKVAKEDNIKKIAEYYKSRIPEKLYNALMNYTVEADD